MVYHGHKYKASLDGFILFQYFCPPSKLQKNEISKEQLFSESKSSSPLEVKNNTKKMYTFVGRWLCLMYEMEIESAGNTCIDMDWQWEAYLQSQSKR